MTVRGRKGPLEIRLLALRCSVVGQVHDTLYLVQVVSRGKIRSVKLAERVTSGREQWLQWHLQFAKKHPQMVKVSKSPTRFPALCDYRAQGHSLLPAMHCRTAGVTCATDCVGGREAPG